MNVLVLTHRLPYPPNRGDRVRAFHIIRHLQQRAQVHVVSLVHDAAEAAHVPALEKMGVRVSIARVPRLRNLVKAAAALATDAILTHVLLDSPEMQRAIDEAVRQTPPDLVLAYCSGVARFALRPPLDALPLIVDFVDVDSAKWQDFAGSATGPMRWLYRREARLLAAFEGAAAERARAATVVNEREQQALVRIAPRGNIHVLPNGVDAEHLHPDGPPSMDQRVIFPAVFNYRPNSDGAIWLARDVWPLVTTLLPQARLVLAGASPTRAVRALARNDKTIEVTGAVPDMRPYLWRSAVAVAPLFLARGVQNKVLEAAAAGLPCVVTPAVRNGLPDEVLSACHTAETPVEFANAIIQYLLMSPAARRRVARSAVLAPLSWRMRLGSLDQLLYAAADTAVAARA
jgi:sugar transferase (PEP-CTERM/EpsH1 system associated)